MDLPCDDAARTTGDLHRDVIEVRPGFYAQIATGVEGDNVRIVTMYVPNPGEWSQDFRVQEGGLMKCRVCRGSMEARVTVLPFKIGDASIVILKGLPVL